MDTAISMVALDKNGVLCGGVILPGVRTGYDALCERTAQLTQIELCAPSCGVLGTNSAACMQAGAVFGTASMLDGILERFSLALKGEAACVATGAFAPVVLKHCRHTVRYEENLLLDGLRLLYEKKHALNFDALFYILHYIGVWHKFRLRCIREEAERQ